MNKKTNLFVCILIALSINLQSNKLAFAEEVDNAMVKEQQSSITEPIEIQAEKVNDPEIIDNLSEELFAKDTITDDAQMQ